MSTKYWCFTVNNEPRNFWAELGSLKENTPQITYVCGQLEQGSDTEHLHFQGYIQLTRSYNLSWMKNHISATAHFEKQRGTNGQARDYTFKEDGTELPGTFVEYGVFAEGRAGRGARNDLTELVNAVKENRTQRSIIEDETLVATFAKFIKFHDRCRSLYKPPPNEEGVKVILFVGSPGTGKTRKAFGSYPDLFEIPISNGTLWLDGYDGHEEVLFDDFMGAGSKITLDNTLKFLDRYVRCVPIKGAYVWYKPKVIVVTTNYHPRHWYKWTNREESYKALMRRFHEVYVFVEDGEPEEQIVEDYFMDEDEWPEPEQQNFGANGDIHNRE